jgi:glycosyltransferase involved in cell wall biosynthesis
MMASAAHADVGLFFGRPDRSRILARELRGRGLSVAVYGDTGEPGGYVPVGRGLGAQLRAVLATRHGAYLTSLTFTPALALYVNRRLRGRPYVFNAVGVATAMYRERARRWPCARLAERWLYPWLMERVLAGASHIACNSRYLEHRLREQFPHHAARMSTVYNGVAFERFAAVRARAMAPGPAAGTLVSVMTWHYPGKSDGARLLIDALEHVRARRPDARLVIAVKAAHRRYAAGVEAHLATRPWRDAVTILYNHPRVEDLLGAADVFVYATPADSNDSLPRAVLEAHAAGLPIVATATAGCPEVVLEGQSGFTVPYEAEPLARRVLDLLDDADMRAAFGARGRQHVREVFSWEQMGEAYARIFRGLVGAARAGGTVSVREELPIPPARSVRRPM